jgi:hypothetical protein
VQTNLWTFMGLLVLAPPVQELAGLSSSFPHFGHFGPNLSTL